MKKRSFRSERSEVEKSATRQTRHPALDKHSPQKNHYNPTVDNLAKTEVQAQSLWFEDFTHF
jgi:hypothetical protein